METAATSGQRILHVGAGGGTAYSLIGEVITVKVGSDQTADTFSIGELLSYPGGGPPLHSHPAAEIFIIQDGEFEFSGLDRGDTYTIRATPGDIVYIPGGAPHTYRTISPTPGRAVGVLSPGGEMERFFAEVSTTSTATHSAAGAPGPPSEEDITRHIAIAKRHGIVFLLPEDATMPDVSEVRGRRE